MGPAAHSGPSASFPCTCRHCTKMLRKGLCACGDHTPPQALLLPGRHRASVVGGQRSQTRSWACSELPTDPEAALGYLAARRDITIFLARGRKHWVWIRSTCCVPAPWCAGSPLARPASIFLEEEASTCTSSAELLEQAVEFRNKACSGSISAYAFLQRAREARLKHTYLSEELVGQHERVQQVNRL